MALCVTAYPKLARQRYIKDTLTTNKQTNTYYLPLINMTGYVNNGILTDDFNACGMAPAVPSTSFNVNVAPFPEVVAAAVLRVLRRCLARSNSMARMQ